MMKFSAEIDKSSLFPVITLSNLENGVSAEVYAFGALLNKFQTPVRGQLTNVVDGFTSPSAAIAEMTPGFKSAFLSPFTCRMNKGQYDFDGKVYQIEKFFLPPHAIHGLVYDAVFSVVSVHSTNEEAQVLLRYHYEKNDAGYPFAFTIQHLWKLTLGDFLSVTTTIEHHNDVAIPYAQGWHPYFTLGGSIDTASLQFSSNQQLEFDDTLLPTGELIDDRRFEQGNLLAGTNLDNCFALNADEPQVCTLENEQLKLSILPDLSYPYLQVYTPPHRNSIAIENLSGAPDCFNNKMGLRLLAPNLPVVFKTTYQLTVK